MDFFEQQARARRKTKWLVFYFALAVISMIVTIYAVLLFVFAAGVSRHHHYYSSNNAPAVSLWNPELFFGVSIGVCAVVFLGSAYKTMMLSSGGSAVAESLGARLLASNTADLDERKLLNVVEEMSIASGVPMPKVYVQDEEDEINAFAAGYSPSDAAVTVTRGCMTKLTRDELQGVVGHEFSHILNGDMRLNIRLIGILFGIFCVATIGRIFLQFRSGNSRDRNPLPLVGLALLVIGSVGVFFGRLIQAAVSRQREFLADASSVQFTRNPGGLSGALQKIGAYGSVMHSPHASDASHLFFANGLGSSLFDLLATHPPLPERIRAIDPAWDGKFHAKLPPPELPREREADMDMTDEERADWERVRKSESSRGRGGQGQDLEKILGAVLGGAVAAEGARQTPSVTVLPNLGNPTPLHLKYAEELRNALPDGLKAAAREPLGATALIYALLLADDEALRAKQLAELAQRTPVADQITALLPDVAQTAARTRLPLVNLALPALRQLNVGQYNQFSQALEWLINSDEQVEMFEFVVQKIVLRHLEPQFRGTRKAVVQYYTLKPLVPDAALILSALAHVGSAEPQPAEKAFATGAPYLRAPENSGLEFQAAGQCGLSQIDAALNRLALSAPIIKHNLLEACARVVGADGVIQESEAELLRAVADTLDCPLPPLGVSE